MEALEKLAKKLGISIDELKRRIDQNKNEMVHKEI